MSVGIAAAASAVIPAASAAQATVTLEGPNVVTYATDLPFVSSVDEIVQGSPQADGDCAFEGALEASDERPVVGSEEVAFDPDTCRSIMRSGVLQEVQVARAASNGSANRTKRRGKIKAKAAYPYSSNSDSVSLAGNGPNGGTFRARRLAIGYSAWEDPAQINVNQITNTTNWRPSTTCTGAGFATLGYRESWFDASGWRTLNSLNFLHSNTCSVVASRANRLFFNKRFCNPTKDTFTYIENRVQGARDGSVRHTYSMIKNGDCASLLHREHRASVAGVL